MSIKTVRSSASLNSATSACFTLASKDLIKVLGRGELKAKLKVTAHKFTASAKKAIEDAGGEAIEL